MPTQARSKSKASKSKAKPTGFVKESLEQAQVRLEAFEKEAQKVLEDLRARSKSSRKELTSLLEKFQAGELFESARSTEKKMERQVRAQANRLSEELADRLAAVQNAILSFVGVASREQVEELVQDLEKISKRLERLAKARPTQPKKKAPRSGTLDA